MRSKRIALLSLLTVGALALGTRGADAQTAFREGRGSGSHGRTSFRQGSRDSFRSDSFRSGSDRRGGNWDRGSRGFRSYGSGYRGYFPRYRSNYYPIYGPVYDPYYDDPGYYASYGPGYYPYYPYPRYRVRRYVARFPVPRVVIPLPPLPGLHFHHHR